MGKVRSLMSLNSHGKDHENPVIRQHGLNQFSLADATTL